MFLNGIYIINFGIDQFDEWFHDQLHLPTNQQELH